MSFLTAVLKLHCDGVGTPNQTFQTKKLIENPYHTNTLTQHTHTHKHTTHKYSEGLLISLCCTRIKSLFATKCDTDAPAMLFSHLFITFFQPKVCLWTMCAAGFGPG